MAKFDRGGTDFPELVENQLRHALNEGYVVGPDSTYLLWRDITKRLGTTTIGAIRYKTIGPYDVYMDWSHEAIRVGRPFGWTRDHIIDSSLWLEDNVEFDSRHVHIAWGLTGFEAFGVSLVSVHKLCRWLVDQLPRLQNAVFPFSTHWLVYDRKTGERVDDLDGRPPMLQRRLVNQFREHLTDIMIEHREGDLAVEID